MGAASSDMSPRLLFVIGASGAGKTAAVQTLERRRLRAVHCYYFDTIGVPSSEEMEHQWGGGDRWQEDATRRWIERLRRESDANAVSVLDGQTRPSFIRTHAAPTGVPYRIVLLDCDPATRATRLRDGRSQPELATPRMDTWAAYLRGEATALGLSVIDTSHRSIEAVADALEREVNDVRAVAVG